MERFLLFLQHFNLHSPHSTVQDNRPNRPLPIALLSNIHGSTVRRPPNFLSQQFTNLPFFCHTDLIACVSEKKDSRMIAEKGIRTLLLLAAAMLLALTLPAKACGPEFPSSYLEVDDDATIPWIDFAFSILDVAREYRLLPEDTPRFKPSSLRGIDAEVNDFTLRLNQSDIGKQISVAAKLAEVTRYRRILETPREPGIAPEFKFSPTLEPKLREYTLYHQGVAELHQPGGMSNALPEAWIRLMALPPAQRQFRTSWVLYMSGIIQCTNRIDQSHASYQALRDAVKAGFFDTCGLAYASFKREYHDGDTCLPRKLAAAPRALAFYSQFDDKKDYRDIIRDLMTSTDCRALTNISTLKAVLADPIARELLIARFADRHQVDTSQIDQVLKLLPPQPVRGAERMAFLAYIRNDLDRTRKWINACPSDSLVALWLQAEMLRREGKYNRAAVIYRRWINLYESLSLKAKPDKNAQLLAATSRSYPSYHPTSTSALPTFDDKEFFINRPFDQEVHARLGTTLVHKRDFLQALDAFIRAGAWTDAAYLADNIIPLDELRKYVDANSTREITRIASNITNSNDSWWGSDPWIYGWYEPELYRSPKSDPPPDPVITQRAYLRYLLGRRLIREGKASFAAEYLPSELTNDTRILAAMITEANDAKRPSNERAMANYNAARILRWRGIELSGTELFPDSRFSQGQFFFGVNPNKVFKDILPSATYYNNSNYRSRIVTPTGTSRNKDYGDSDLISTLAPTKADQLPQTRPTIRFHYRLRAANLMLKAADLSPETNFKAMALYTGGDWIRIREPELGNLFYKRLVKECRSVDLGAESAAHGCFAQNLTTWFATQVHKPAPALTSIKDIPAKLVTPSVPMKDPP